MEDYVRYLDLRNAIAGVRYSGAGVSYTREYLSSFPDKVIAVRLAADKNGKISVRLRLRNNVRSGFVTPVYADGVGSFEGKLDLVDFKAAFKAVPTGGTVTFTADGKDKITFPTVKDGEYRIVLTTASSVSSVEASQAEGPWEYYDLSGRRVAEANLSSGIYIRQCGSVAEKIIVR